MRSIACKMCILCGILNCRLHKMIARYDRVWKNQMRLIYVLAIHWYEKCLLVFLFFKLIIQRIYWKILKLKMLMLKQIKLKYQSIRCHSCKNRFNGKKRISNSVCDKSAAKRKVPWLVNYAIGIMFCVKKPKPKCTRRTNEPFTAQPFLIWRQTE